MGLRETVWAAILMVAFIAAPVVVAEKASAEDTGWGNPLIGSWAASPEKVRIVNDQYGVVRGARTVLTRSNAGIRLYTGRDCRNLAQNAVCITVRARWAGETGWAARTYWTPRGCDSFGSNCQDYRRIVIEFNRTYADRGRMYAHTPQHEFMHALGAVHPDGRVWSIMDSDPARDLTGWDAFWFGKFHRNH